MGLYISSIEIPKEGRITIQIGADGAVYTVSSYKITAEKFEKEYHVTEVPEPHGRLGDLDELYASLEKWLIQNRNSMTEATRVWIRGVLEGIAAAPTVIKVSEEECV